MSLLLEGDYEFASELLEEGDGIQYPSTQDGFSVNYTEVERKRVSVEWVDSYTSYISFSILRGSIEGHDTVLTLR